MLLLPNKTTIKYEVKTKKEKEIEVTYPIFFTYATDFDSGDFCTKITKVNQDGTGIEIEVFNDRDFHFRSDKIYSLDRFSNYFEKQDYEYGWTTDPEEFDKLLHKAVTTLVQHANKE